MTRNAMLAMAAAAALATTLSAGVATAQSRAPGQFYDPGRGEAPPLTVRKRPFTDSGTVVPYGYENEYFVDQTVNRRPVYSSFNPDAFGQDVLPRPFDGLGLN